MNPQALVEFQNAVIRKLTDTIDGLEERLTRTEQERDYYFQMCRSYELWQNRAIDRVKEMQNG